MLRKDTEEEKDEIGGRIRVRVVCLRPPIRALVSIIKNNIHVHINKWVDNCFNTALCIPFTQGKTLLIF